MPFTGPFIERITNVGLPGIAITAATAAVTILPLRRAMEERTLRQETFTYHHDGIVYRWDVSAAWRLLLEKPREPTTFVPAEQGVDIHHLLDRYGDLDIDYALTCDTTLPLLFVPFNGCHQLIDGWHRLARVLIDEETLGSARIPAYILTVEEADAVLLFARKNTESEPV
jgi:hypothetical protein